MKYIVASTLQQTVDGKSIVMGYFPFFADPRRNWMLGSEAIDGWYNPNRQGAPQADMGFGTCRTEDRKFGYAFPSEQEALQAVPGITITNINGRLCGTIE